MKFKVTLAVICLLVLGVQLANSIVILSCNNRSRHLDCRGGNCIGNSGRVVPDTDGCDNIYCNIVIYNPGPGDPDFIHDYHHCYPS